MIERLDGTRTYGTKSGNYLRISLTKLDGTIKAKGYFVHIIIAQVFLGPKGENMEVNHIDHNGKNNHIDNLEYLTRSENMKHSWNGPNRTRKPPKPKNDKRADEVPVVQLTLDKRIFVARYKSISQASKETKINSCNIASVTRGKADKNGYTKKSAGGFYWMRESDYNTMKGIDNKNQSEIDEEEGDNDEKNKNNNNRSEESENKKIDEESKNNSEESSEEE